MRMLIDGYDNEVFLKQINFLGPLLNSFVPFLSCRQIRIIFNGVSLSLKKKL